MPSLTLQLENVPQLKSEIKRLVEEKDAVVLAHNYMSRDLQNCVLELGDRGYIGDSLQLARRGAEVKSDLIVFCGVHFMAETTSVLCPEKEVRLPDHDAGCSLADSITPDGLKAWKAEHPDGHVVMYVNTTAEIKSLTDTCVTSSNAVAICKNILEEQGDDQKILFGPDMFLGSFVKRELEKSLGRKLDNFLIWMGECHVHAGIRPEDINRSLREHPDADFLVHPECGCQTSVAEMIATPGDISPENEKQELHLFSTGQMIDHVQKNPRGKYIVATENNHIVGLERAAPEAEFIPANPKALCGYMAMITLPKLRDALAAENDSYTVKVDEEIAEKARVPIERMVAIG
jgi:quinolinate synthase